MRAKQRKSYPREDGKLPRVIGKAEYVRCPGCGGKVQMPCYLCAMRKREANKR